MKSKQNSGRIESEVECEEKEIKKNCRDKRVIRERGQKCRKIIEREMANSETKLKELF